MSIVAQTQLCSPRRIETRLHQHVEIGTRLSATGRHAQRRQRACSVQCVLAAPRGLRQAHSAPAPQLPARAAAPERAVVTLADEITRTAAVRQELGRRGTWDAKASFNLSSADVVPYCVVPAVAEAVCGCCSASSCSVISGSGASFMPTGTTPLIPPPPPHPHPTTFMPSCVAT